MSNVLNTYIANQALDRTSKHEDTASFTFNTSGRIKPMKEKGRLLPSRIIGSPVEYAKDLKKDVVSIGKAAKGQANDHELGRINDLAMKLGSLALAAYLFVKNPLKLNKTMEFVGFGTFFGSMALWPKLAIQAPLKARTGVDIHQKYVDSQGRKKMLYQDPQYDLTDLYSREDLDKMGEKMGISKDMPDRDSFIKQRAKKTAVQGNTLWMLTAGIASPVMSALACNRLEKPIGKAIEEITLKKSENDLFTKNYEGTLTGFKQYLSEKSFERFLKKNADKPLDDKMISKITSMLGKKADSASMEKAVADELTSMVKTMQNGAKVDGEFVKGALKGIIPDNVFASLTEQQKSALDKAIQNQSLKGIADVLAKAGGKSAGEQKKLSAEIMRTLNSKKAAGAAKPTVSQLSNRIKPLYDVIADFGTERETLGKYINARVGDQSGTYIANQWGRIGNKFIKSLKLNSKELEAVSRGNTDIIADKLSALASNEAKYDKVVKQLMKLIGDYETKTGDDFIEIVRMSSSDICSKASKDLQVNDFISLSKKVTAQDKKGMLKKGTVENFINLNASERVLGAKSSFYRLLQSLDVFKQAQNGSLQKQLAETLKENGQNADEATVDKLIKVCKDIIMDAKITDYTEKLKSSKFGLSEAEYKTVMKVLFNGSADTAIDGSLIRTVGADNAKKMTKGFKAYKDLFTHNIADWKNEITPELSRRVVGKPLEKYYNANERNNIAGKSINSLIQDVAKQTYNSQKWLKIFGGTMLALTAVTLGVGLTLGRKGKTEKQVEKENNING